MMVTSQEIARVCGVSRGTVDRALNGRGDINQQTRDRIIQTARELGYKPDLVARSLVSGRTKTIGVVLFDLHSRFMGQLAHWLEATAVEQDYFINIALSHRDPDREARCIEHLLSRRVDGLVIFPVGQADPLAGQALRQRVPVVSIVNRISADQAFVGINDQLAITEAVAWLVERQHQRIIYAGQAINDRPGINNYAIEQRLAGFRLACQQHAMGDPEPQIIMQEDYAEAVVSRLGQKPAPTAILAYNDSCALEILASLKQHRIRVPTDVSLMGFDNLDLLKFVEPGLTTVSYPIREMARLALGELLASLDNPTRPVQTHILPHQLVFRDSVAAAI